MTKADWKAGKWPEGKTCVSCGRGEGEVAYQAGGRCRDCYHGKKPNQQPKAPSQITIKPILNPTSSKLVGKTVELVDGRAMIVRAIAPDASFWAVEAGREDPAYGLVDSRKVVRS